VQIEVPSLTLTFSSWVYLFFFNMLWVFLPLYALYNGYKSLTGASPVESDIESTKKLKIRRPPELTSRASSKGVCLVGAI
jgi:hypothetical protein